MKKILPLIAILLLLSSCKIFFTHKLRKQLDEQEIPLEKIQFYTSKKIILQRIESEKTVIEDSSNLKQTSVTTIERIKIKRNTPGVCVNKFDKELEIKFEEGDSCTLKFVLVDTLNIHARYKIGALKWENEVGMVPYDGKIYYIKPRTFFFQPKSHEAALKVKKKFLHKLKVNRRKVKGVKLEK